MNPKSINWNDLRIFMEVGRSKTLSLAARQLGIDDSTVSRRIAQLEYSLGEAVFSRDHVGFHLTPKGRELLDCVQEMESGALAVAEAMGGRRRGPSGRVRVASMEGISSLYLAGQFVELRRRHPALEIELVTSPNVVYVNRREADVFLSFFAFQGRGVHSSPIGEFRLKLYASPAYLEAQGAPTSLADLEQHVFASYVDDLVQLDTVRWLNEAVSSPKAVFHSTSMLAQMFSAAAGMGLVMLPTFARAERFGLVPVLEHAVSIPRVVWLTVHRDLQYASRIKAVVGFLEEILKRDHPLLGDVKPTDGQ